MAGVWLGLPPMTTPRVSKARGIGGAEKKWGKAMGNKGLRYIVIEHQYVGHSDVGYRSKPPSIVWA
jgi:hypothetical protein